jgi:hypothetical protein
MRRGRGGDKLEAALLVEELEQYPRPMPQGYQAEEKPLPPLYMEQPPIGSGRLLCKCGMCEVCHHFKTIDAQYAGRLRAVRKRPYGEPRFRFAHVVSALEWYADLVEDGGLRRFGSPLGAVAETGTRVSGSDVELEPMERIAWYVGAIREALGACYLGPSKRALSKTERIDLMLLCGVGRKTKLDSGAIVRVPVKTHVAAKEMGHNLDAQAVGEIVRDGLSTVYRVLRTRGVVG